MSNAPEQVHKKGSIKATLGLILFILGIMGGVGILIYAPSWKEILSDGIALCIVMTAYGWILIKADRVQYHIGWMSISGGILATVAFLVYAMEFEYSIFDTQQDTILSLTLASIIALFGALLLYLGHCRHRRIVNEQKEMEQYEEPK